MTLIVTLFSFFRPFAFSDSCVVKLYIKVPVQIVTVHHNLLIPIKIRNIYQDYTSFSLYYQIKLPLDLEISIPSDDPVRLVSAFVEEMDLSELYKTYGRIRKNQATPRQMLKLVIYAAMNRIYSSRDIRKACKRDINFRYLLEGNLLLITQQSHVLYPCTFLPVQKLCLLKCQICSILLVRFQGRPSLLTAPRSNLQPINIHLYGNGLSRKIRLGYTQN